MKNNAWIIFGATSPIAREFAHLVSPNAEKIILVGRDEQEISAIAEDLKIRHGIACATAILDFSDPNAIRHYTDSLQPDSLWQYNLLITIGSNVEQEHVEREPELSREVLAINYTNIVYTLNLLIPLFESQQSGNIIVLGSVAGDRGRYSNYVYGSAKSGLETYLQGLRARLYRANVTVTTMKLGFIDTSLTYGKKGIFLSTSPRRCAEACLRASRRKVNSIYFPRFWFWIMLVLKLIPEKYFKQLKI